MPNVCMDKGSLDEIFTHVYVRACTWKGEGMCTCGGTVKTIPRLTWRVLETFGEANTLVHGYIVLTHCSAIPSHSVYQQSTAVDRCDAQIGTKSGMFHGLRV